MGVLDRSPAAFTQGFPNLNFKLTASGVERKQMERFTPRSGPRDIVSPPTSTANSALAVRAHVASFQAHVRALVLELAVGAAAPAALASAAQLLGLVDYDSLVLERQINGRCGYACCGAQLPSQRTELHTAPRIH